MKRLLYPLLFAGCLFLPYRSISQTITLTEKQARAVITHLEERKVLLQEVDLLKSKIMLIEKGAILCDSIRDIQEANIYSYSMSIMGYEYQMQSHEEERERHRKIIRRLRWQKTLFILGAAGYVALKVLL
jgi:hypothetical protein